MSIEDHAARVRRNESLAIAQLSTLGAAAKPSEPSCPRVPSSPAVLTHMMHKVYSLRVIFMPVWEIDYRRIEGWLASLDTESYELVVAALELLTEHGPHLGRPLVDRVSSSRHSNMKELRPGSRGRTELRILFAFDIQRTAVLLVAGDKRGGVESMVRRSCPAR